MDDTSTPSVNPQTELAAKLKSANNVLVTVSRNPSVDQLASCIGLTLLLNKQGKHAAAVFSGQIPSTIEFLQPEETLEKNTDSLRDFIIALDKSKADKLRYKVEDQVVRIFITPYKTSITQDDLDFSQGDFNVDIVVGLGVQSQDDIDEAITAHGRILHDATVATINTVSAGELGSINWTDSSASSLCELVTSLGQSMGKDLIDQQIATALLTGIVAETARFSNEKTTSTTMSISAVLMTAGANQQLVASRLNEHSGDVPTIGTLPPPDPSSNDGSLEIAHEDTPAPASPEPIDSAPEAAVPAPELVLTPLPDASGPVVSDTMMAPPADNIPPVPAAPVAQITPSTATVMTEPPALSGMLSANTEPEALDPSTDPLSLPQLERHHLLTGQPPAAADVQTFDIPAPSLTLPSDLPAGAPPEPYSAAAPVSPAPVDAPTIMPTLPPATQVEPPPAPVEPPAPTPPPAPEPLPPAAVEPPVIPGLTPPPPAWTPPAAPVMSSPAPDTADGQTLTDLETSVNSQHVDSARDEVSKALSGAAPTNPEPVQALNAQPMADQLNVIQPLPTADTPPSPDSIAPNMAFDPSKYEVANDPDLPSGNPMTAPMVSDPTAPPPVPPPIPFQFGTPSDSSNNPPVL